jgi:radical SAM protein with 4Fe4S-binding SPASM domain
MPCPHPWKNIFVTITGDVYPCCFNTKLKSFGNINNNDIRDIWFGEAFTELRKAWIEGGWKDIGCDGCRLLSITDGNIAYEKGSSCGVSSKAGRNSMENADEFAQRKYVINTLPTTLTYFPSTFCNLSCVFCGQNISGVMDLGDTGYEMLKTVSPYLRSMTWLGGEPAIQPQLSRWIDDLGSFDNVDIEIGIITNASIYAEKLINASDKYSRCSINISFDSHQKDLYESLRRKSSFEQTLKNIDRYLALRKGSDQYRVNLNFLWQKKNFATLPHYLRFCREREVFALINPLDYWPVPMRLDLFEDLQKDLPEDHERVLEQALMEAKALDDALGNNPRATFVDYSMGMPGKVLPYVQLCVDLVRKGIAAHKMKDHVWEASLGPDHGGQFVIAQSSAGEMVSYAHLDDNGSFRIRLAWEPGATLALCKDCYGTPCPVQAKDIPELSRNKRVALWGTGQGYADHVSPLVRRGVLDGALVCFLDNSPAKQGAVLDGYPICPPGILHNGEIDVVFILSCMSGEILSQVRGMNIEKTLFVAIVDLQARAG